MSHRTAPLELRERLAHPPGRRREFLGLLADSLLSTEAPFHEAALLDTCNRTEYYFIGHQLPEGYDEFIGALADLERLDVADRALFEEHAYVLRGSDAVVHLLRVAAGLESMIVGEYQILGQVKSALLESRAAGAAGPGLTRLFETAVRAGRRARHETDIGRRAASVPAAAVALARRSADDLGDGVVVVIGAGKMGLLTAKALASLGVRRVIVSNRSYAKAVALAEAWEGCAVHFDQLHEAIAQADVVIASTAAPHAVVSESLVAKAMASRPHRPLTIVDIAVPRDVEAEVATIPGVTLFDIDDLQAVAEEGIHDRTSEIPAVEAIVGEEAADFAAWARTAAVEPTVAALYRWAEGVREAELNRALRRLNGLGDREVEIVRALSVALVGKLLHPPTASLKERALAPETAQLADTVRHLFDLPVRTPSNQSGP